MTRPALPVVLIGPMAAGKSHVAQHLAEHYGLPHVDTDRVIESRYGPIPRLFRARGEAEFRQPDPEARWSQIMAERRETFERLATIRLDGAAPRTVAQIARELYLALGEPIAQPRGKEHTA